MFRELFHIITRKQLARTPSTTKDAESIFDNANGSIYDTLSIDCADDVEDVIDSVEDIDMCEDMVDYYDE